MYSYNLHQATYRGLRNLPGRENIRPFSIYCYFILRSWKLTRKVIGRGAFAGAHRYAGLWAGDNSSSWDFLKMNVNQALALGICSMSINGQGILAALLPLLPWINTIYRRVWARRNRWMGWPSTFNSLDCCRFTFVYVIVMRSHFRFSQEHFFHGLETIVSLIWDIFK